MSQICQFSIKKVVRWKVRVKALTVRREFDNISVNLQYVTLDRREKLIA